MLRLISPAGIGDTSWVYSKIADLAKERSIGLGYANWEPLRTKPFAKLLPDVEDLGYQTWINFPKGAISHLTNLANLKDGTYFIECNTQLESGIPLADIFPRQSTQYHYDLNIPQSNCEEAKEFIQSIQGKRKIGLYCSSYHGEFWRNEEWLEFITEIDKMYPDSAYYFIGARWDKKTKEIYDEAKRRGLNCTCAVAEHIIGTTLSVIKQLDYFFAYPSGLGIMADVLDVPCMMWYWSDQHHAFLNTYADPVSIESGRHLNLLTGTVRESLDYFAKRGARFLA